MNVLHDASTDPGNSGGPCVDMKGNVLGVHYAGSTISKNARNYAVSPLAMQIFLNGIRGYEQKQLFTEETSTAAVVQKSKDSVFLIEAFTDQVVRDVPGTNAMASTGSTVVEKYRLIKDHSCLLCTSKEYIGCSNCANGYIYTPVTAQIGTTVVGEPIYEKKTKKTKCSRRSRGGKIPCPRCKGTGQID